ncbi:MAG: hypothetical protein IT379_16730 [Deltaproteobacteria bacterium]|nr:hypothetical protein [Deltaproteobacteria bacterium]
MTKPRQVPIAELRAQMPMEFLPLIDFLEHARSFAVAVPEPGGGTSPALDLSEAAAVYVAQHPKIAAVLISSLAAQHIATHAAHPGYRFVRTVKLQRCADPQLAPRGHAPAPCGVPADLVAEESVAAPSVAPPRPAPAPYWLRNLGRTGAEWLRVVGLILAGLGAYHLLAWALGGAV